MPKVQMTKREESRFVFSITIPAHIVELAKISKGDELLVEYNDGKIIMEKTGGFDG